MHQQFLAHLQQNLADIPAWLVYADWLEEHDDPTGPFVRLSLELTAGQIAAADAETRVLEYEKRYAAAHPETRQLLATYRAGLTTRFRVLNRFFIGEDPPREMFGYARTIAVGFLENGRLKPGVDLGVGTHADGRPRILQVIELFARTVEEIAAGREPIQVGLGWLGHLNIEVGSVLTPVAAVAPL